MAESKELKMKITRLLTPKEENGRYYVRDKGPLVSFECTFRNLHLFPMEPKARELMFQKIHMISSYGK